MNTGQRAVTLRHGWEGNRRSGVALAMRRRFRDISTYGLSGPTKGAKHPTYASVGLQGTLSFYLRVTYWGNVSPHPVEGDAYGTVNPKYFTRLKTDGRTEAVPATDRTGHPTIDTLDRVD